MRLILAGLLFLIVRVSFAQESLVLLVSFDGFRYDYAEKYEAPNLLKLRNEGVSTQRLIPSYPTKTFPNHYSIITGLYPSHHGLVDNAFYDPARNAYYSIRDREMVEDPYYYGGLPLWQVLQKNGINTGSFFWVGSEAPINGSYPNFYKNYDGKVSNKSRVDSVFNWFSLPEYKRPRFVSLYFSLTDDIGHKFGPDASETKEAVLEADRLVGMILEKSKSLKLPITVIFVSDHGMKAIYNKPENFIPLNKLFDITEYNYVNLGTHTHIYEPDHKKATMLYKKLKATASNFNVYKKKRIPKYLNYRNNARIGSLFIMADPGFILVKDENKSNKEITGTHGYDAFKSVEMGGIFYAIGPTLKEGIALPPIKNVDIFPFILKLLNSKGPHVDGDLKVLGRAFK